MIKDIQILSTEILSDNWYTLNKVTYQFTKPNGSKQIQNREAYDRGNGATILLYNLEQKSIILTRQFRLPTYLNGNSSGMLIVPASLPEGSMPVITPAIASATGCTTTFQESKVEASH